MTTSREANVNLWILRHTKVVWFGIFLNSLFIVPLLFFPRWMLDLFHIPLEELIDGDYPGEAWQDSAPLIAGPDQVQLEPVVRELIEELSTAVESAAGVALEPVGSPGDWFQDSNWYSSEGNGYGGESMLITLNCNNKASSRVQSNTAASAARPRRPSWSAA